MDDPGRFLAQRIPERFLLSHSEFSFPTFSSKQTPYHETEAQALVMS